MPNTPNINLDLRRGGCSDPGWHNVVASNGQTYGYCYTGGDDGQGGVIQDVGQGRDTAPVQLIADPCYRISDPVFHGDTKNQLSWRGNGNRAGTIIDANDQVQTASYSIVVTDTDRDNCTIECDPPVINR